MSSSFRSGPCGVLQEDAGCERARMQEETLNGSLTAMDTPTSNPRLSFVSLVSTCFFIVYSSASALSSSSFLGLHPLDEKYFASEVIKCKDGSKSFTRDRVNDNFCDCTDGTDEPGTSACPAGKFYCRNVGSTPQFLFSSRINDHICDCCDGSDEYDGSINCPNTCVMGGNIEYKSEHYSSTVRDLGSVDAKERQNGVNLEDLIQKVKGLKMVIILQVVLISCVVAFRLFCRRARPRRKHHR